MCLFIVVLNALQKRRRYRKREKTGSGWEEKAFRLRRDGARRACKGAVQGLGDTRVPARQVVPEAQAKRLERPLKRGLAVCSVKELLNGTSRRPPCSLPGLRAPRGKRIICLLFFWVFPGLGSVLGIYIFIQMPPGSAEGDLDLHRGRCPMKVGVLYTRLSL